MRATTALVLTVGLLAFGVPGTPDTAAAQQTVTRAGPSTDVTSQRSRRPRVRIYRQSDERGVYPSYFPGANAVRDCSATYAQEFRPSGTVIVPRMRCFWRQP